MKILFITDLYPVSDKETKTPKTLYAFVKEWQKAGHDVQVLKPNFVLNSFLRHKPFYKTGQYNDVYNVNYLTPFLFDTTIKIPQYDYDVVVAHMPSGIIFSNKLQGKKICAVHVSDLEVLTNPLYSIYFKKQMLIAYENSVGIACRSQVLKDKFLKLFPQYESKTFLCESGIDFEPQLKTTCGKKTITTCANLIPRKNIDKLILAVNNIPEMTLTVIGSGKELNHLKKISGNNINFTGQLDNFEVVNRMKNSDIFILPSVNETFGMVYLEAMASGCITVGIENEGIDGIIKNNENGFLIKPTKENIKEVLLKINKLPDSELNRILQNCYNTVNCYRSADCADGYIKNIFKFI